MYLDFSACEPDRDLIPFVKNGIFIDTSVIKILIDGLVRTRISRKSLGECIEYERLLAFFDVIKIGNRFEKFLITPHVLTEVCTHLRNDYSKKWGQDFKKVVGEVMPILEQMIDAPVEKKKIMAQINAEKPVIEVGDLSIFVATDELLKSKDKVAVLAKDAGLNGRYKNDSRVLILDFDVIVNL